MSLRCVSPVPTQPKVRVAKSSETKGYFPRKPHLSRGNPHCYPGCTITPSKASKTESHCLSKNKQIQTFLPRRNPAGACDHKAALKASGQASTQRSGDLRQVSLTVRAWVSLVVKQGLRASTRGLCWQLQVPTYSRHSRTSSHVQGEFR